MPSHPGDDRLDEPQVLDPVLRVVSWLVRHTKHRMAGLTLRVAVIALSPLPSGCRQHLGGFLLSGSGVHKSEPLSGGIKGQFRVGQRSRQPIRGADADGCSILPPARPAAAGLPGGSTRGGAPRDRAATASPCCTAGELNAYRIVLQSLTPQERTSRWLIRNTKARGTE